MTIRKLPKRRRIARHWMILFAFTLMLLAAGVAVWLVLTYTPTVVLYQSLWATRQAAP